MVKWRDIASAPKDGSGVIVIDMTADAPEAGVGYWYHAGNVWSCVDPSPNEGADQATIQAITWASPTHWTPLPPSPGTPTPDGTGSGEDGAKIEAYDQMREIALELGYPSILEALEATPKRDEEQAGEEKRLKLDLEAQECLQDSAYKAGVQHGWNLCINDDEDGYQRIANNTEHIAELRRIRADRTTLAAAHKDRGA